MNNFSQNLFLKNNNERNKQEQNTNLHPKNNLLDTLHGKAFKAKHWLEIQFSQFKLKIKWKNKVAI